MKVQKVICDVCGAEIKDSKDKEDRRYIPVIFHTNQTDGHETEPYISFEYMDICDSCLMKLTNLHAEGCQGHNKYYWKEGK